MPMDIGVTPPPPPEVMSQMQSPPPSSPGLGNLMSPPPQQQPPTPPSPGITGKIQAAKPLLQTIAQTVPALAPDVAVLTNILDSKMEGTPAGYPGADQAQGPAPDLGTMSGMSPAGAGQSPPGGAGGGAAPELGALMNQNSQSGGAMDVAMQLEMALPQIAADDPTTAPTIQFFLARLREEVPKALSGEKRSPVPGPDMMMSSKIPVMA